jgi:hypothetical protein
VIPPSNHIRSLIPLAFPRLRHSPYSKALTNTSETPQKFLPLFSALRWITTPTGISD